jgi:hypothetical protein
VRRDREGREKAWRGAEVMVARFYADGGLGCGVKNVQDVGI